MCVLHKMFVNSRTWKKGKSNSPDPESGGGEGSRRRGCVGNAERLVSKGGEGEGMKEKKRPSGKSGTRTSGRPGASGKSRRVGHREVVGRAGGERARVRKAAQAAEEGFQELIDWVGASLLEGVRKIHIVKLPRYISILCLSVPCRIARQSLWTPLF